MTEILTYEECYSLAKKKVEEELTSPDSEVVIWDEKTVEKDFGWVFYPETRKFIETQNVLDKVPGIMPILVNKFDSTCIIAPSSESFESFLEEYEQKIDQRNRR